MDSKRDVFHITAQSGWKGEENKAYQYPTQQKSIRCHSHFNYYQYSESVSPLAFPFPRLSGIKYLLRMIQKQKSLAAAQTSCKKTFKVLTVLNFVQNYKLVFRTLLSYELCLGGYFWLMAEYWVIRKNRKNSFILSVKSIHKRDARAIWSREYSNKVFCNPLW